MKLTCIGNQVCSPKYGAQKIIQLSNLDMQQFIFENRDRGRKMLFRDFKDDLIEGEIITTYNDLIVFKTEDDTYSFLDKVKEE